ncbi:MAG: DUF1420 family protein [Saprospiraceae bacterium]|nr:DUF1420 family protein [Saprospiraceae bacterium]
MIPFQINQITYEGLVSNPVWSWFGACMLVLSFWNLAVKGSKFITLVENHWLRVSVSFYALLLVLGESLFSISALAFHQTILLKVLGSLFIFNGVYIGSIKIIQFQRAGYKKIFSKDSIQNLMLLALFLIAIAPVTDADSISYHLATPLQILRNGSNQGIGEYWLHARLLGYGEYINLLGIANGIDCLGAVIQWTGLLLFVLTIRTYFKGPGKELFLYALLSMPCILFLVSTQKPQLSGDLAILTGVIAFLSLQSQRHDYKYLMVLGLPLFYSLTLKYTFYLPVIVLIIVFIATSIMQKTGHSLVKLFIVLAGFYLAFLSPIHLFNYFNYRDPVSPFLSGSSTGLTNFIHYLTGDPGFNIAYIWVPPSLGIYTTTIGLAGILFFIR